MRRFFTFCIFIFASLLFHHHCYANGVSQVFKSTIGRFLLTETQEGLSILNRYTGFSVSQSENATYAYRVFLRNMNQSTHAVEAEKIAQRIIEAENRIKNYRPAASAVNEVLFLERTEQRFLQEYATSNLQLTTASHSYLEAKELFLTSEKEFSQTSKVFDPFRSMEALSAGKSATQTASWQAKSFFQEMKACLKSMPKKERKAANTRLILTQLGIAEASTVLGYVAGSGGKKVDWKNLPTDMVVSGVSSVVEPFLAIHGGSYMMRYIKMVGFGAGKSAFEGVYFYFTPLKDTHGHDPKELALARSGYSTTWAAGSAALKLSMFTTLLGLECLFPTAKMKVISQGVQILHRAGSTFGYFYLRNLAFDSWGLGLPE